MAKGLVAPQVQIDFRPSPRQYELWKLLQPDCCPHCGGHIGQKIIGHDRNGNEQYEPYCMSCGSTDLPQLILGGGAAGGGKMGLLDSTVCTPFGFRKVRDLKVGDIITSATTGGQQRIIYMHPIGTFDFYRVHFVDGTYFDCSEGHLWQLHQSRKRTKKTDSEGNRDNERVWTTKTMFDWMEKKKSGMYKGCNLIIPLCAPVQFTSGMRYKQSKNINPYILGALLGDGCITKNFTNYGKVELTSMDREIVDKFIACGYDMSYGRQKLDNKAINYIIESQQLTQELDKMELSGCDSSNKFIPKQYLYATIEERKQLLQGLMDTDGYVDSRGHLSYSTISNQLAKDVAFLVRSLGGIATIKKNPAGYKKDGKFVACNDVYDVYIRTKIDPEIVSLTRKKNRCRYEFNGGASELGKRITDIEYIGKKEGRCITVDEPCGLYVADDFTVTHNSYLGSCWLISSCMRFPNLRAVVARKTLSMLKKSTWNTIKTVCNQWGLKEDVHYHINNVEGTMTFWNDSVIMMQEMATTIQDADFQRFGSAEWTIAFVDEVGEIDEKAIEVLFSRLRWRTHETFKTARMFMSTNPCITWIRSRFVQDDEGNPVICRKGEAYVPFSVFDNPDKGFVQTYVNSLSKISDRMTRERLLYGNWDFVEANVMAAYQDFDGEKHLVQNLKEKVYDPTKPLISGWDFNVAPYMSEMEFQINYEKKEIYLLEENLGKPEAKENNTPTLARKIRDKKLQEQHIGGIVITGDPSGNARTTQTEDGVTNYTIIVDNMRNPVLRPYTKLLQKQPSQTLRLEFVNAIFRGFDGWKFYADLRCRKFTEDMIYQKKNDDGTKCKAKVLNPKTGGKEEKYGHLSDILDYTLCLYLRESWMRFQNQAVTIQTYTAPVYNTFEY